MTNPFVPPAETLGNLKPIATCVFSLGSNMGNSVALLQAAVTALAETPGLVPVALSGVYRTAPVGTVTDQPDFLNLVLVAESVLEPITLLERGNAIEDGLGRVRDVPGGPRTLDVDLVMVGGRTSDTARLTLPHPRAHERAFVLVPWLEAEPTAELPGRGRVADLVAALDTTGVVRTDEEVVLP